MVIWNQGPQLISSHGNFWLYFSELSEQEVLLTFAFYAFSTGSLLYWSSPGLNKSLQGLSQTFLGKWKGQPSLRRCSSYSIFTSQGSEQPSTLPHPQVTVNWPSFQYSPPCLNGIKMTSWVTFTWGLICKVKHCPIINYLQFPPPNSPRQ